MLPKVDIPLDEKLDDSHILSRRSFLLGAGAMAVSLAACSPPKTLSSSLARAPVRNPVWPPLLCQEAATTPTTMDIQQSAA
jgi:hypothetical protein